MASIEDCFERGLLRRVEPSARKGAESLALAASYLAEARATAGIGANRASFAAAYMVWFHAARAVLFRDGVREKSHHCIEVYLEAYVAAERLEEEWVLLFGRLRSRRHENQYSFGPAPADEEVAAAIDRAGRFVERIRMLLEQTDRWRYERT